MRRCFADTYYFLAFLNHDDGAHEVAAEITADFDGELITTDWVLMEVADAMSGVKDRTRFISFLQFFRSREDVTIVRSSERWFDRGLNLYARRRDKEWSLTDCISFAVMEEKKLIEGLTGDHHFEQAGFKALMKE